MGSYTTGFQELIEKVNRSIEYIPTAIDYSLQETANDVINTAKANSPVDTGTLVESWEVDENNSKLGENSENSTHVITVFSNPEIIAMNPKHPDGNYYPFDIEYGFTKPNGDHYPPQRMLQKGMKFGKTTLKQNLSNNLKDVFR